MLTNEQKQAYRDAIDEVNVLDEQCDELPKCEKLYCVKPAKPGLKYCCRRHFHSDIHRKHAQAGNIIAGSVLSKNCAGATCEPIVGNQLVYFGFDVNPCLMIFLISCAVGAFPLFPGSFAQSGSP